MLGVLPPHYGVATVELAAINAAMAGVEPEAFPLVIAALEAIVRREFNAFGLTTTTSSVFPMLHRQRPVPRRPRHRLPRRVHGRRGRARLDDHRARGLAVPAQHRRPARRRHVATVFGQPARFGLCFGEWEERSPWPSLAERRGFPAEQEVVTVHGGKGTFPIADINNDDAAICST